MRGVDVGVACMRVSACVSLGSRVGVGVGVRNMDLGWGWRCGVLCFSCVSEFVCVRCVSVCARVEGMMAIPIAIAMPIACVSEPKMQCICFISIQSLLPSN